MEALVGIMGKFIASLSGQISQLLMISYISLFLTILVFIMLIILFILVIAILAKTGKKGSKVAYVSGNSRATTSGSSYFAKSRYNRRKVLLTKN